MILHVYTSTHNDLYILRYFIRHYELFASKIFVYDDDSTDGTREFLQSCAPLVEIRNPGFTGIDELKLQHMRCTEYKKNSRGVADWIMIVDCDEFHWHNSLMKKLGEMKGAGYAAVISHGWNMFSTEPPDGLGQMTDYVKCGVLDSMYDRAIFRPECDVLIGIGNHGFTLYGDDGTLPSQKFLTPCGAYEYKAESHDKDFKLLHYKYLGLEYLRQRYARVWSRTSDINKSHGWGIHASPTWNAQWSLNWYQEKLPEAKQCIP
jgi:hypothetical protein